MNTFTLYPVNQRTHAAFPQHQGGTSGRAVVSLPDSDTVLTEDWEPRRTTDGLDIEVRRVDCGGGCRCAGEIRLA